MLGYDEVRGQDPKEKEGSGIATRVVMARIYQCLVCDHEWERFYPKEPWRCPKCKSRLWDASPARRKYAGRVGRPPVWPWMDLEVGQTAVEPWRMSKRPSITYVAGKRIEREKIDEDYSRAMSESFYRVMRIHQFRRYRVKGTDNGMSVERVADANPMDRIFPPGLPS